MNTRTKPPTKPVSPNVAALARQHGTSRESIRAIRDRDGVDLNDPAAVSLAVRNLKGREDGTTDSGSVESYTEARRRRAVADADSARIKADIAAGKVIELAEVKETFMRLGHEMKSRLLMMRNNLVNELVGRDEVAVSRILDERITDLLQSIFEDRDFSQS